MARRHWGRGYAPEAARAAMDWARDALGADHVISLIEDDNHASQRVAEKLGMTVEGRTRILAPQRKLGLRGGVDGSVEVRIFGADLE